MARTQSARTPGVKASPLSQRSHPAVAGWLRYVIRRLLSALATVLGVATVTFVVLRLVGNPVYLLIGQQSSPEIVEAMTRAMGLDQPIWVQYLNYLGRLAQGDYGISRASFRPVAEEIGARLPATFELVCVAMVITVAIAVPFGVLAAVRRGGWTERASQWLVQFGTSVPPFWFGLLLIFVFFARLELLPAPLGRLDRFDEPPPLASGLLLLDSLVAGRLETFGSALRHLILPALTLALTAIPASLQITRTSLLQVLDSQYIRTARAFGLRPWTIYSKYALRNVLVPLVTVLAMTFGFLMSGTVLVELIFAWPGIGLYAVTAMSQFDYEPIQAVVIVSALFYVAAYLVADVLAAVIDPRVRA